MKNLHSYYKKLKVRLIAQVEEGKVKKVPTGIGASCGTKHRAQVRTMG